MRSERGLAGGGDAIVVCDLDERVTYVNEKASLLFNIKEGDWAGRPLTDVLRKPSETREFGVAREQVRGNGEWQGKLTWKASDGKRTTADCCWTLVRDANDAPMAMLMVSRDLREQEMLGDEPSRRKRETLGALVVGIAHQLNDIFQPLLLEFDKGAEGPGRNGGRKRRLLAKQEVQAGADLVSQILDFSSGRPPSDVAVKPDMLVRTLEGFLRRVVPKSISIRVSLQKKLPAIRINGSEIFQMLLDLVVRAMEHKPRLRSLNISARRISIDRQVALMTHLTPGGYVVFTVSTEDATNDGEAFALAELKDGKNIEGLDALSTEVARFKGTLKIRERKGKERDFVLIVPTVEENDTAPLRAKEDGGVGNGEVILVVDDEVAIRESTRMTLQAAGYAVLTAGDGAEAAAIYAERSSQIAVVLIDIMMPHMSGDAAIRTMFQINPNARIIATSGYARSEQLSRIDDLDQVIMLQKPYPASTLLTVVNRVLARGKHAGVLGQQGLKSIQ